LALALWIVYGLMKSDVIIILANAVSLALLLGILYFKLRELQGGNECSTAVL
jgi:MtN3 and saliva related transmembrane protein